jgi:hypothetical protein
MIPVCQMALKKACVPPQSVQVLFREGLKRVHGCQAANPGGAHFGDICTMPVNCHIGNFAPALLPRNGCQINMDVLLVFKLLKERLEFSCRIGGVIKDREFKIDHAAVPACFLRIYHIADMLVSI